MQSPSSDTLPQATRDLSQATADLSEWGYCLVADALDAGTVEALSTRLSEQAAAERALGVHADYPVHNDAVNQWLTMLVNKGDVFLDLPVHGVGMGLARHLLGEEFLLSIYEAHILRAGGSAMALHCDQWAVPMPVRAGVDPAKCGDITRETVCTGSPRCSDELIWPPTFINVMYMITDFTVSNGATKIVPASHLSGHQPDPRAEPHADVVNVEGCAGTALAWDGRTWHAAGVNTTDQPRIGLTASYCGPMFRQISNFAVGVRDDVLNIASPELKRLLGFTPWGMYGAIDDPGASSVNRHTQYMGELR